MAGVFYSNLSVKKSPLHLLSVSTHVLYQLIHLCNFSKFCYSWNSVNSAIYIGWSIFMSSHNSGFVKQYIKCKCKPVSVAKRLDNMQSTTCKICAFDCLISSFLFVDKRVFVFSVPMLLAGLLSSLHLVRDTTPHLFIALNSFDPIRVTQYLFHWTLMKRKFS